MNSKKISKELACLRSGSKRISVLEEKLRPFEADIIAAKKRGVPSIRIYEVLVANDIDIKKPSFYSYINRKLKGSGKENNLSSQSTAVKAVKKNSRTHRIADDDELF